MEKTYNPALIQRTQRYMETHSISQNQFAAKVNLSSAALSSYLNQKYKGSVEAVERQLSEFFKLDEEAEAAAEKTASLLPRAAYVPTSISEDVCQSIRFAQLEHCMVVLHGDAGVGKSKGAQKFLRDHPTNAVGISITPSTGTLNGSIKLLARALRVPECRNKMDQMMALRSRLDGTNWVIVIDEAQHLKYAALEEIRSLTDDNPMTGEHGVGVVLIGNSEVYSRLQGRQQAQFAQLFSRIRMQREYTTRKVKEDDVRKLFPVLAEQDLNGYIQPTPYENIDIIVADVSMGTLDMALFTKISRENIVRSILRPVIERGYYDYILIDTNPNLSLLNFNIVNASNFVLIPAQPASFDLDGLAVVLQFVEGIKPYNPTLQVGGIIINRYDARNRLITEAAMDQLREAYSPLLFEQIIRVDSRLQNAQWENRPVQDYAGNARISKEYRALTKEILRRCS